jgi:hypothetical protein
MGNPMTQAHKDKLAAARAAKKAEAAATGQPAAKRANLAEQLAAVEARANAGDADAQALMPAIDTYKARMEQAIADKQAAGRKLRKLLSTLKD